MNKYQTIAFLIVCTTGCSAPRSFVGETGSDSVQQQQKPLPLSRTQSVAQLQVDAASVYGQMIQYFLNEKGKGDASEADSCIRTVYRRLDAVLSFRPGSTELQPAYGNNRDELARVGGELEALAAEAGGKWQSIRITGYASPDGHTARNEELAIGRALRFSNFLSGELAVSHEKIVIAPGVEDWDGLKRIVTESKKPYAAQVTKILEGTADPDARRKALKALEKGNVWKEMEQTVFSRLRRMKLEVVFESEVPAVVASDDAEVVREADLSHLLALFNSRPEELTLEELLTIAPAYRPGTEQFREVYEQAAYRFPDCVEAQLNAGAAALAAGDTGAAHFFLDRVKDNPEAWINQGVLCLMENQAAEAATWFRKALPFHPGKARRNLEVMKQI